MESHAKDLDTYASISRGKRKRARAILDFERKDDDELGFRKNDIVTIVSQRDEHCWVGELNGHIGWFPAKLVTSFVLTTFVLITFLQCNYFCYNFVLHNYFFCQQKL
jgi:hypothetical protein